MKAKLALIIGLFAILLVVNVSALECQKYEENTIWSSDYSNEKTSESYYNWEIQNNCPNKDCLLKNLEIYVRSINFGQTENSYGSVMIKKSKCSNPESENFEDFIGYQTAKIPRIANYNWNCGNLKENNVCSLKFEKPKCFAIKVISDKEVLTDVLKIKYSLCWEQKSSRITGNFLKIKDNKEISFIPLLVIFAIILGIFIKKKRKNES